METMRCINNSKQINSKNDRNVFNFTRPLRHLKIYLQILFLVLAFYFIKKQGTTITVVHELLRYENDIRHILIWTELPDVTEEGQKEFLKYSCNKKLCYLTKNRTLFNDIRYFDAVIFNLQDVSNGSTDLPKSRGLNQKYIFAANDSADKYPVCDPVYDGFFNWTWTYRLESTIRYQFINTQTLDGIKIKGNYIQWQDPKRHAAIRTTILRSFSNKRKAAAIFLDQCTSRSKREDVIKSLQKELAKYNLTVDVYGDCGTLNCKRRSINACRYRIRNDYFFYLAFEEFIGEDFVTDVVLHAYSNNAVPIVYGGAEYNKFIPEKSYLDMKQFNITGLVRKMYQLMQHKRLYAEYFNWKFLYDIIKEAPLDICDLCTALSAPKWLIHNVQWDDFRVWWHPNFKARCAEDHKNTEKIKS